VQQPVTDSIGQGGVAEIWMPVTDGTLAGARGNYYVKSLLPGKDTQAAQEGNRHLLGEAAKRRIAGGKPSLDIKMDMQKDSGIGCAGYRVWAFVVAQNGFLCNN
jgi:hypothetical protein